MGILIWSGVASFLLSLLLTPLFRDAFRFYGFVDRPDHSRKTHSGPIPRAGGAAIAVSYIVSFLILQLSTSIFDSRLILVWKVLPAAAVIFAVGIIDDLWGLKPWQKLTGQFLACGIACSSGILILDIIGKHERAWWTVPITILWLLACSNAFNLVDGMDGLAGGVGLFATLTILVAALIRMRERLSDRLRYCCRPDLPTRHRGLAVVESAWIFQLSVSPAAFSPPRAQISAASHFFLCTLARHHGGRLMPARRSPRRPVAGAGCAAPALNRDRRPRRGRSVPPDGGSPPFTRKAGPVKPG